MIKISTKFRKFTIFAIVAVIFIFLILVVTSKKKTVEKPETIPSVVVQKPVRQNLVESILISGYVEANAMIPVVPFVSGTIMEYPVRAGDFVQKDTLLTKIDAEPFKQQMLQAQAAYSASKSTFERVESLFNSGATTKQNYDTARAQYDANRAQYDLAKLQMDYTEVRAPVSGTVLIAGQAVGNVASQSNPVAVLADLNDQVVRLKVPEKYYDLFSMERDSLVVTIIRPAEKDMYDDAVTSATIENIAPYISPESKTFEVVCHLDNPGERFRPGMYVKVHVAYRVYENVPVLPIQAKKMDGSCYIFKKEKSNFASGTVSFVEMPVTPCDDDFFIVPDEFADEYFVIDGQNFVFDGQSVRLYDEVLAEY